MRRVIFPNSVTKIIWVGREVKVKSNGVQCKEEEKYFEILDIHGNFPNVFFPCLESRFCCYSSSSSFYRETTKISSLFWKEVSRGNLEKNGARKEESFPSPT